MSDPIGRADLEELLELSRSVDRAVVRGPATGLMLATTTGLIRCRRLARAVKALLDAGLELEAEILNRVLLESGLTIAWMLAAEPEHRLDRLRLSDLDRAHQRRRGNDRGYG